MLKFLERHFEQTGSDDVGALLGSANLLDDGRSADPAMQEEWRACAEAVRAADADKEAAE
jgi:hypothetical protein